MPIKKENRDRYPKYWKALSYFLRNVRAKNKCECTGQCGKDHKGKCKAVNYQPHPITNSKVVLTVAHLDHTPENCEENNLLVMCQDCHLRYDKYIHAFNRHKTLMLDFGKPLPNHLNLYLSQVRKIVTAKKINRYKKYDIYEKANTKRPATNSQILQQNEHEHSKGNE